VRYQYALSWKNRAAFTLIELLVVIAIIGILASLLLAGVMAVLRKGPEVNNRNDIMQLGVALDKFKTKYGFYPPSKIKLVPQLANYNMANPLDQQSSAFLSSMWTNLDRQTTTVFAWAGPGVPIPATGITLEGHQCLVFFLGGIPSGGNNKAPMGFSTNPLNPTDPNPDRFKFIDFESGRCEMLDPASPFPSYLDSHSKGGTNKKPFLYFSSYKRNNGYSPFGSSDNVSLGVSPYVETSTPTTVKYINPTTYQLISAGADGAFGPGGLWTPSAMPAQGRDDIANFSDRNLGVSP
jgi:prepilin-type N-terminal cleavage/methylation domain-containing protein